MKTLVLILSLLAVSAMAANVTLTVGAGTGAEAEMTRISGINTTSNYGTATSAYCDGQTPNKLWVNWRDTISKALYGNTADSGQIQIKSSSSTVCEDCGLDAYCVRPGRDGVESQMTWMIWKTSNYWTTAGAGSTASDIYSGSMSEVSIFTTETYFTWRIDAAVARWDGLDTANANGVIIKFDWGGDVAGINFYTDDNATTGNRPILTIWYHTGMAATTIPARRRREGAWLWPDEESKQFFAIELESRQCDVQ